MKINVNCLKMYPGLVLIMYSETHRNGNDCHKGKRFHYTRSHLVTGGGHTVQRHTGKHWGQSESRKNQGTMWTRPFIMVSWGKARQAGWAGLNTSGSPWGAETAPNCLVPGPGVIGGGDHSS